MDKFFAVAQVIAPIFVSIFLGVLAKKKQMLTQEENRGLQQFVMKFGLPCIIFNSCLSADIGAESLTSMALVIPFMLVSTFWAFGARKKLFPYHNMPQMFCAQETGMLGIPLFMILFGTAEAYRMGVLDMAQAITAYPTIAILSAKTDENPSVKSIIKAVLTSPFLIMAVLGLSLNLLGIGNWMNAVGFGPVITESTGFLAQPVSAIMIFSVGYNFSLAKGSRAMIFKLSAIHFAAFAIFGILIQLILLLIPDVDPLTRWVLLLYCALPASYLAPSLGRTEEEFTVSSGVCSILTVVTLVIFCVMATIVV
jgi:predicted permease